MRTSRSRPRHYRCTGEPWHPDAQNLRSIGLFKSGWRGPCPWRGNTGWLRAACGPISAGDSWAGDYGPHQGRMEIKISGPGHTNHDRGGGAGRPHPLAATADVWGARWGKTDVRKTVGHQWRDRCAWFFRLVHCAVYYKTTPRGKKGMRGAWPPATELGHCKPRPGEGTAPGKTDGIRSYFVGPKGDDHDQKSGCGENSYLTQPRGRGPAWLVSHPGSFWSRPA